MRTDIPLEELKRRAAISDVARGLPEGADFFGWGEGGGWRTRRISRGQALSDVGLKYASKIPNGSFEVCSLLYILHSGDKRRTHCSNKKSMKQNV